MSTLTLVAAVSPGEPLEHVCHLWQLRRDASLAPASPFDSRSPQRPSFASLSHQCCSQLKISPYPASLTAYEPRAEPRGEQPSTRDHQGSYRRTTFPSPVLREGGFFLIEYAWWSLRGGCVVLVQATCVSSAFDCLLVLASFLALIHLPAQNPLISLVSSNSLTAELCLELRDALILTHLFTSDIAIHATVQPSIYLIHADQTEGLRWR